jgi:hypothetical protein
MSAAFKRLALVLVTLIRASAQPAAIADAEALQPPTAQRLAALHRAAQADGWAPHVAVVRDAAIRAYQSDKLHAAEPWYHVYRWAALFAESEATFVPRWIDAVNAAKVGHANMAPRVELRDRPLGANLSPALQAWLMGNAAFSTAFFSLLHRVDFVPRVFEILDELHRRDAARFRSHAALALAIAVVFDVPPPPVWPHSQVTPQALARRLPAPADAFAWWIRQEQLGRTYHKLSRLGAGELKFVVDAAAPPAELEWVQNAASVPLNQLARAYTMVRYRRDRLAAGAAIWPGPTYTLQEILAAGGICSDQAYFATQAGKARGVPTLLIYGAGSDARHAWFGFLDGNQQWQLDAGRYAEQRFVTGYARDPQTWAEFSDHELRFLTERFRELAAYRQSRVHANFAEEFLALARAPAAAAAARRAVNFERRNQAAWETLLAAAQKEGRDAKTIESVMREAALAFQRYPDLEAHYVTRVAGSLRARGETSAADAEVRRIALKNRTARGDLSVQQAKEIVQRAIATQTLPDQIRAFNSAVDTYGRGAGVGFFDDVVRPFVQHLMQRQHPAEARRALARAREALRVDSGSQLHHEIEQLAQELRGK